MSEATREVAIRLTQQFSGLQNPSSRDIYHVAYEYGVLFEKCKMLEAELMRERSRLVRMHESPHVNPVDSEL